MKTLTEEKHYTHTRTNTHTKTLSGHSWWADTTGQGADRVQSGRPAFFLSCSVVRLCCPARIRQINRNNISCFACGHQCQGAGFHISGEKSETKKKQHCNIFGWKVQLLPFFPGKEHLKPRKVEREQRRKLLHWVREAWNEIWQFY